MRQRWPPGFASAHPGYSRFFMNHDRYDDAYIRGILNTVKRSPCRGVGHTSRPSYFVFKYLLERGYRMIPVNPGLAGQHLVGAWLTPVSLTLRSRLTWSTSSAPPNMCLRSSSQASLRCGQAPAAGVI